MKRKWTQTKKDLPQDDQAVEYLIEILCKGWYKKTEKDHIFQGDTSFQPKTKITKWRPAKE